MKLNPAEVEIVLNDDVLYEIKQTLKNAKPAEDVFLVSPYIKLDTRIREALEEAITNKVQVTVLMRADADHSIEDIKWLRDHRVILRQVDKLHAKIYLAADRAIVGSMNLHTYSGSESKEIAIVFRDEPTLRFLRQTIDKWHAASKEVDLFSANLKAELPANSPRVQPREPSKTTERVSNSRPAVSTLATKAKGFCIRCGTPKTFNPKYPLCDEHQKVWEKYSDENYPEKVCHRCGKPDLTKLGKMPSHRYPLCKRCYDETAK